MEHVEPRPAATVILVREQRDQIEVLLLLRDRNLAFSADSWVFPGGKIEVGDYGQDASSLEYHAALRAAVRETREEAGISLDHRQLIHTAHWTTPEHLPLRYSTWFFLCPVRNDVQVQIDNHEIRDYRWISPSRALREIAGRRLKALHPTRATLEDLQHYCSLAEVLRAVKRNSVRVFPDNSSHYNPEAMGVVDADRSGNTD